MTQAAQGPVARITEEELADGFVPLIGEWENGGFNKHGWNHYGPGWFTLDHETGILASHGGMGLLWYSAGDVRRLRAATRVQYVGARLQFRDLPARAGDGHQR